MNRRHRPPSVRPNPNLDSTLLVFSIETLKFCFCFLIIVAIFCSHTGYTGVYIVLDFFFL